MTLSTSVYYWEMRRRSFLQLVGATAACAVTPAVVDESYAAAPALRGIEKHWVIERGSYTGRAIEVVTGLPHKSPEVLSEKGINAGFLSHRRPQRQGGVFSEEEVAFMPESEWDAYRRQVAKGVDPYDRFLEICKPVEEALLVRLRNQWAAEIEERLQHYPSNPSVQLVSVVNSPMQASASLYGHDGKHSYYSPHVEVYWSGQHYLVEGTVKPSGRVWSEDGKIPLVFEESQAEAQKERDRQVKSRIQYVEDVEAYEQMLQGLESQGHINARFQKIQTPKQLAFEVKHRSSKSRT